VAALLEAILARDDQGVIAKGAKLTGNISNYQNQSESEESLRRRHSGTGARRVVTA